MGWRQKKLEEDDTTFQFGIYEYIKNFEMCGQMYRSKNIFEGQFW